MKIRFLGTSYGAPAPGRHQQSLLLETESGRDYLVDAGAPVLDILAGEGYDFSRLKAIFITHLHGDHMNGLADILNLAAYFGIRCGIYLSEQRGIDAFEIYCRMQTPGWTGTLTPFFRIEEGAFYDDGVLKVRSVQTAHMKAPCFGFLLEADASSVYVTGDLSPSLEDFPAFLDTEPVGMLVTECAHFSPEELYERIRRTRCGCAAVIHVMPPSRYEALTALAADMPMPVLLPEDGDVYGIR
ncbi:MAG: ribonuclease Z [Clostridia bacterium]|nr:ribonuclease Z [Clostridia bacterium]